MRISLVLSSWLRLDLLCYLPYITSHNVYYVKLDKEISFQLIKLEYFSNIL